MNKNLKWLAMGGAVLGMGITMPSCPGQQAMQQQIDTLQSKDGENTKKLQMMDQQIKVLNNDMRDVKTLLTQVSNTVLAQKSAIDQLDAAVKSAVSRPSASPSHAKASAKKRRH